MALYRMFTTKKQDSAATYHAPQDVKVMSQLLKELWLYSLNSTAITLSPEATRALRHLAIERGQPPDYFLLGTHAFNTDIEAIKRYRHLTQRIWEYAEKLFLSWWQQWLQFRLQLFLKQKRANRFRKKKKSPTLWELLLEEEQREGLAPLNIKKSGQQVDSTKTLWTSGLHILNHIPAQAAGELPDLKIQWENLYKFYEPLNNLRQKIETQLLAVEKTLEKLLQLFSKELQKQELAYPADILEKIVGIFMANQVKPAEVYQKLAQQPALIPLNRAEVIRNIAAKQENTRKRQLGAILDVDRVNEVMDTIEQCWNTVYTTIGLDEVERVLSESYEAIEDCMAPLQKTMLDMLQAKPLKPQPAASPAQPFPTVPLENQQ